MLLSYFANLKFDGKTLKTIDTDEVVEDFTSRLWKDASREEVQKCVDCHIEKAWKKLEV